MLLWLRAQNVALLREVSLEFGDGLNVLTGETGVGKSVVLEALGLALGGRGRAQLIGPTGGRTAVEAGFSVGGTAPFRADGLDPTPLQAALEAAGADEEEGEILVRRELRSGAGGRSIANRTTINGAAAPVSTLRQIGGLLAEIYSQGEHLALLEPGAARATVDSVNGHQELVREVAAAFRKLREAEERRDELEARRRRAEASREEMERALDEIERAAPEAGENEALVAERRTLGEAERLLELLEIAYNALYGAELAAGNRLGAAFRALEEAASVDAGTAELLEGRPDLVVEVEDLASAVRERQEAVQAAPDRLATIEDRLALLRRLERRHLGGAGGADALIARREELRSALGALADESRARREAAAEAGRAAGAYRKLAQALTEARTRAAAGVSRAVERELAGLGIPKARFSIRIESLSRTEPEADAGTGHFTAHGMDRLEFLFSANPEMPPAPAGEVASGGESSRFFLALKAAGAGRGGAPTLIFDEVDTGVSGRIADAVGRRLGRLAESRQVICVTHLPQVAALGTNHLVVEKLESGDSIRVRRVTGDARIEEIARMLAGPEITESARQHAGELLAGAGSPAADSP